MQSIDSKILSRIYGRGKGCVVTPGDFLDLGSRQAVDLALHRLAKKGTLRRLARGLYDYPRIDPALGLLSPTIDAIVKALKGRDKILLQPSGGYAANLLGLSDQVPMKIVFLTDGPARRVQIGKQVIMLKHTTPRAMATGRAGLRAGHPGPAPSRAKAGGRCRCGQSAKAAVRQRQKGAASEISATRRPGSPPFCGGLPGPKGK